MREQKSVFYIFLARSEINLHWGWGECSTYQVSYAQSIHTPIRNRKLVKIIALDYQSCWGMLTDPLACCMHHTMDSGEYDHLI